MKVDVSVLTAGTLRKLLNNPDVEKQIPKLVRTYRRQLASRSKRRSCCRGRRKTSREELTLLQFRSRLLKLPLDQQKTIIKSL